MTENDNPELAKAYFIQGDKYYVNQNFAQALDNYIQGFNLTNSVPAQIKFNMGICQSKLDDDIKCLQTLSLITIDELGLFNDFDSKLMFFILAQSFLNLEYYESALNIVNFNLKIQADITIEFQSMILDQKLLLLVNLNLFDEGNECADGLISLINNSIESSEFLETKLTRAFVGKAILNFAKGNSQEAYRNLRDGKIHASKSDDKNALIELISSIENNNQ